MRAPKIDSLARRFALAAVALAVSVLVLTSLASWWLVDRQQQQATRVLLQKEAGLNLTLLRTTINAIYARLEDAAEGSLLANALIDSAGRQTYVVPFLDGMQRVNGIEIQLLFTDFEGREIASSGRSQFSPAQMQWLQQQLKVGKEASAILPGVKGDELVVLEVLTYSRTKTPEGALLYKVSLADLQAGISGQLLWEDVQVDRREGQVAQLVLPLDLPPLLKKHRFRLRQTSHPSVSKADGNLDLAPSVLLIGLFALVLGAMVWFFGSRLAQRLTFDLRQLEAFARSVVNSGFGDARAPTRGSTEVVGLARSINHMLDRLHEQHAQLQHESEERYRLLVEGTNAISWEASVPDFVYLFVSSQGQRIVGHELELWQQGHFWRDQLHPDDADAAIAMRLQALHSKTNYRSEYRFRCANGSYLWLEEIASVLCDAQGTPIRLRGILLDVDERKLAEQRLHQERLKVDRLKNDFVSTVSHELRTPLTSIRGSLGLILGGMAGPLPGSAMKLLDIAHKNTERLVRLINDLLDIDKIASGKMDFDLQWHELAPLIELALETNAAYGAQLKVTYVLKQAIPKLVVKVDHDRMLQVMANLLSNAAKFSPEQGTVEVSMQSSNGFVRVAVQDHGPGISEEFRHKIFQKFSQQDSSDTRLKGGTGLGLAITKALVEKMGGQMGFESSPGQGTTFYFDLPL